MLFRSLWWVVDGLYERIGRGYSVVRQPDCRIERLVLAALGDARTVVNVGAGTGAYEPTDRQVFAVEPSAQMRSQRSRAAAPCVAGVAERLPLTDGEVDAAMAIYTDFHWADRRRGVDELRRVSRRRVVILTVDGEMSAGYWLFRDYFPAANRLFKSLQQLLDCFPGPPVVKPVEIPADCSDGFVHAFWKRPRMLLEPAVHGTMAALSTLEPDDRHAGWEQLRADLDSGLWAQLNSELDERDSVDLGHRLVIWEHPQK